MATAEITSGYSSAYKITIDYTAGNGSVTVNGIEGNRTDGYGPTTAYNASGFTLSVGSHTKTVKYVGFGNKSYLWWNANGTSSGSSSSIGLTFSATGTNTFRISVSGSGNTNINNQYFDWTVNSGSAVVKPTLSAVTISNTTSTSTSASFSVTNTGGATVTAQGCEFSTSNFGTVVKSFTGTSGSVTGLSPNTTYYARAYATNSAGTGYSAVKSFTTLAGTPVLSAVTISNVTTTGASASFSVTNTGGATITSNAIKASLTNFGTAVSTISSTSGSFSGLSPGTLYYVRAEASNGTNTGYSAVTSLSTSPTVTINPLSNADGTSVILNKVITGSTTAIYYNLYDANGTALVTNAAEGSTVSGYSFNAGVVSGLTPGVKYGFSLKATYTAGASYNSNGTTSSISYVTTSQLTDIMLSTNGNSFSPRNLYLSVNGGSFVQIPGDKITVIK